MKFANRLTDEDLKELFTRFTDDGATILELTIHRGEDYIGLSGEVEIPEWEEDILLEDPDATVVFTDDYDIDDFCVAVYTHSGDCTRMYRKYMYEKFGDEYARNFLLGDC